MTFLPLCAIIAEQGFRKTSASRLNFLYINSPDRPAFKIYFLFGTSSWPCMEQVKHTIDTAAQQWQAAALQTLTLCPPLSSSTASPRSLPDGHFSCNLGFSFLPSCLSFFFIKITSTGGSSRISHETLTQDSQSSRKEQQWIRLAAVKHSLPHRNGVAFHIFCMGSLDCTEPFWELNWK